MIAAVDEHVLRDHQIGDRRASSTTASERERVTLSELIGALVERVVLEPQIVATTREVLSDPDEHVVGDVQTTDLVCGARQPRVRKAHLVVPVDAVVVVERVVGARDDILERADLRGSVVEPVRARRVDQVLNLLLCVAQVRPVSLKLVVADFHVATLKRNRPIPEVHTDDVVGNQRTIEVGVPRSPEDAVERAVDDCHVRRVSAAVHHAIYRVQHLAAIAGRDRGEPVRSGVHRERVERGVGHEHGVPVARDRMHQPLRVVDRRVQVGPPRRPDVDV